MAAVWLTVTVVVLVGTYASLPSIAGETLNAIGRIEASSQGTSAFANPHAFTLITLGFGVLAIACASLVLGKVALAELESAGRLCGFADALCVSGNEIGQFEKAAAVFVPKSASNSKLTSEDLRELAELAKKFR
jgi:hypothetical protein